MEAGKNEVWDFGNPAKSLQRKYEEALGLADQKIKWYVINGKRKSFWSKLLRAFAIILAGVGGVIPLLEVTSFFKHDYALGQWGYVFFALAASLILFDRFFGISSGWIRYMNTRMEMESLVKDFRTRWLIEMVVLESQPLMTSKVVELLDIISAFSSRVMEVEKKETEAWAAEFQQNISEIQRLVKTEVSIQKTGSIAINVTNATEFDKVIVKLNGITIKTLEGSSGKLSRIPPGNHEVTVTGIRNVREHTESSVVQVTPDTMAILEITLPVELPPAYVQNPAV